MGKLEPCPSCRSQAMIIDKCVNNIKGVDIKFGRVICVKANLTFIPPWDRCYMKTIAGPIKRVVEVWNTRI